MLLSLQTLWQHMHRVSSIVLVGQADRERLTQLLFEDFNIDGLFLCDAPVLALYSVGKVTGCVVDIGHEKAGRQPIVLPMPPCTACVHA